MNTNPSQKKSTNTKAAKIFLSSLNVFFAIFVVVFLGFSVTALNTSCSTTDTYGTNEILSEDLSTGQKIQNVVSSPFRVIGGLVIYPLKALFVDFPTALYDSFDSELTEYAEKLKNGTQMEKEEALFFLSYSSDPEAWKLILGAFYDGNPDIRKQAVISLTKCKNLPEDAVVMVRDIIDDTDADSAVLLAAIYAIGDLGDESDIECLREIYNNDENADVFKSFALLSMAKLGAHEAEAEAVEIMKLEKQHAVMYANALLSIGFCGMQTDEGKKILHETIANEDERVVTAAITGLGVAKDFVFLEDLLNDSKTSDIVKKKILVVLGEYGGASKIDLIRKFMRRSKNDDIRQYAIFGLAKARYKPIIGELVENLCLDSPEIKTDRRKTQTIWVRLWSLGFLYELTGENYGIDYEPWKKWWESNKEEFLESTEK